MKRRYEILDGLRGVAALMVVWYHIFEGFATSAIDQRCNHGYLAVDFFFILSGFVVGYAYDDRWKEMGLKGFFKRRLIRLHPLVILGAVFGLIAFIIQGCVQWDGTAVASWKIIIAFLLSIFLIPAYPGTSGEIRGNGEMFPLNGPSWSLFFEYIGNIMYALCLRKLSTKWLKAYVAVSGLGYAAYALGNVSGVYNMGVGWSIGTDWLGMLGGFLRMSFTFSAGLLMSRNFTPVKIRGAFWACSAMLIGLLSMPYLGKEANILNAAYDILCTVFIFPCIVLLGASGNTEGKASQKVCSFAGAISYPLYIIQYPFMYLFYAWLWKNGYAFGQVWYVAAGIFVGLPILAYAVLKLYDEPVRKWLSSK